MRLAFDAEPFFYAVHEMIPLPPIFVARKSSREVAFTSRRRRRVATDGGGGDGDHDLSRKKNVQQLQFQLGLAFGWHVKKKQQRSLVFCEKIHAHKPMIL